MRMERLSVPITTTRWCGDWCHSESEIENVKTKTEGVNDRVQKEVNEEKE